ncbi:MAG: hypothetical protein WCX31_15000 [Salinivirgaceae bacterium]
MKTLKFIILLAMLSPLFIGCDKFDEEAILTPGEKVGKELTELAQQYNITETDITYLNNGNLDTQYLNKKFTIEKQFIIVEGNYYNLDLLSFFRIQKAIEPYSFELFFP